MSDGASGIASFNWYRSERRSLHLDQFHLDHYNNDKFKSIIERLVWRLNWRQTNFLIISPKLNSIKSDLSDEQMVINSLPVEIMSKTYKNVILPINYEHSDKDTIYKDRMNRACSLVLQLRLLFEFNELI